MAALAGGSLGATIRFTKATNQAAINTPPEPVTNTAASIAEEAAV